MKLGPYVRVAGASLGSATVYLTAVVRLASKVALSCVVPPIRMGGIVPDKSPICFKHVAVEGTEFI